MTIRPEHKSEYGEIEELIRKAFLTARVSDGDEHEFAARLRDGAGYIPSLALVAEIDGRIAGHIMLTRHALDDGTEVLLLAPLSIAPDRQSQGIGSALVREAMHRAFEEGHHTVAVLGDPNYYGRFGFVRSASLGIRPSGDIPEQYVQIAELRPGALHGIETTITF